MIRCNAVILLFLLLNGLVTAQTISNPQKDDLSLKDIRLNELPYKRAWIVAHSVGGKVLLNDGTIMPVFTLNGVITSDNNFTQVIDNLVIIQGKKYPVKKGKIQLSNNEELSIVTKQFIKIKSEGKDNNVPVINNAVSIDGIDYPVIGSSLSSRAKVPIFMDLDEFSLHPGWGDWARVAFGVMFPNKTGTTPFITIDALTGGVSWPVIIVSKKGNEYTDPDLYAYQSGVETRLTRSQRERHFNEYSGPIFQFNSKNVGFGLGRTHYTIGISTTNLKIGDSNAGSPADRSSTAYFLGGSLMLNPYVNLNAGLVGFETNSHLTWRGAFGFTLDLDLLGHIFHGSGG